MATRDHRRGCKNRRLQRVIDRTIASIDHMTSGQCWAFRRSLRTRTGYRAKRKARVRISAPRPAADRAHRFPLDLRNDGRDDLRRRRDVSIRHWLLLCLRLIHCDFGQGSSARRRPNPVVVSRTPRCLCIVQAFAIVACTTGTCRSVSRSFTTRAVCQPPPCM